VVDYVSRFYRRGFPGAADKARSYVRSAFGWAIKSALDYTREERTDWGVKHNPAADVPRDEDATGTRERALSSKELATLWAALDGDGFTLETAACVKLLICLGQRVQETLRADGCEIDLDTATWNMPKHKTKLKLRPHTIPLPAQAVEVFRQLKARHADGPLFPARTGSKAERIRHRSINQALGRWLELDSTTVADFQTRDLRRTWKSRTGEIGISKEMRDLIQQHAKNDTGSTHYDRADYVPQMRQAMAAWGAWLENNVVQIQQHKQAA
jgi:integrase